MSLQKIFFVEGNIGTGKSTFLKMIEQHLDEKMFQVIYEPIDTWTSFVDKNGKNILQYFYNDQERYAYTFRSVAFISRVEKLSDIDMTKKFVFIERSIWSDKNIFANNCHETGKMSDIEYKLYERWFSWLEKTLNLPKFEFVYLQCSPEVSYARMKSRNRTEESGVSLDYLEKIEERHKKWLFNSSGSLTEKKTVNVIDAANSDLTNKDVFMDAIRFLIDDY